MGAPGQLFSINFPELVDLDPVLTEIFYANLQAIPPKADVFFRFLGSEKSKETDLRLGAHRMPPEFRGKIEYYSPLPDYTVEYSHTEFADGFAIQRKMLDDLQYDTIFDEASSLAEAFSYRREYDAASVFNNAFSTSYTGYDSKALCEDDHPLSENDSTAVDNEYALTLSVTNLNTVRQAMRAFTDDQSKLIAVNPDVLLVPPELERTGIKITRTEQEPDSGDWAANMFSGLKLVVWDFLTDANAWFLIDSKLAKKCLKWYDRIKPEFAVDDDFDTMARKYRGYMRYSYGWSDFRWVIGSNPS